METNRRLIIVLISLGIVLLLVAGCIFFFLWWRGNQAQQAAQSLLEQTVRDPYDPLDVPQNWSLQIPKIELELPVIWEYSEENLDTSICRYSGPEPGKEGHLIITGHAYIGGAHFGRLNEVQKGASIYLIGSAGKVVEYIVYDRELIRPDNVKQLKKYQEPQELTLMTCTLDGSRRLLVRCEPVRETSANSLAAEQGEGSE